VHEEQCSNDTTVKFSYYKKDPQPVKKSDLIVGRDLWKTKPATQMDLYDYKPKQVIPNRSFEKQLG
jgi:hypothetical protein